MRNRITDDDIKQALDKSNSFRSEAARLLGISPQALHARLKKSPELEEYRLNIISRRLDFAENELFNLIAGRGAKRTVPDNFLSGDWAEGNDTRLGVPENVRVKAIQMYLEAKGKQRGYAKFEPPPKNDNERVKELMDTLSNAIERGGRPHN